MEIEPEIKAMGDCFEALEGLNSDSKLRVLQWLSGKFNITLNGRPIISVEKPTETVDEINEKPKTKVGTSKTNSSRKTGGENYSIDGSLDLRGNGKLPDFKSFYDKKRPSSKAEFNLVAIYYLAEILKISDVNLNQIYTCYKEVSVKPPDHFKQSFRDTKSRDGYIDYDDQWSISLTHRGKNFVEHDLPKKTSK